MHSNIDLIRTLIEKLNEAVASVSGTMEGKDCYSKAVFQATQRLESILCDLEAIPLDINVATLVKGFGSMINAVLHIDIEDVYVFHQAPDAWDLSTYRAPAFFVLKGNCFSFSQSLLPETEGRNIPCLFITETEIPRHKVVVAISDYLTRTQYDKIFG